MLIFSIYVIHSWPSYDVVFNSTATFIWRNSLSAYIFYQIMMEIPIVTSWFFKNEHKYTIPKNIANVIICYLYIIRIIIHSNSHLEFAIRKRRHISMVSFNPESKNLNKIRPIEQ